MRRVVILLVVSLMLLGFVSANLDIHNKSVEEVYSSIDPIEGSVNATITYEPYNTLIEDSSGNSMELGDFLKLNDGTLDCFPADCKAGYKALDAVEGNIFNIVPGIEKTVGFAFTGTDVVIYDLSFDIESDFLESVRMPLEIDFCEDDLWEFDRFSKDAFTTEDWGCYNPVNAKQGKSIGRLKYCEPVYLYETNRIRMGADFARINSSIADSTNFTMGLYFTSGSLVASCKFDSEGGEEFCETTGDFSTDDYYVCIGADEITNYNIYQDKSSDYCGFSFGGSPDNSTEDYGVYVQGAKYDNYTTLVDEFDASDYDLVEIANNYLQERYGKEGDSDIGVDCVDEACVLPLTFSGASQRAFVKDAYVEYSSSGENFEIFSINDTEEAPVYVSYDGVLDLGILDFYVNESGLYELFFGDEEVFSGYFNIETVPNIVSIFPLNPPAGILVKIFANVEYEGNNSLDYIWSFGSEDITTTVPYVEHLFEDIKSYTVSLKVDAGDNLIDGPKDFEVSAISPSDAIDSGLKSRYEYLNYVKSIIEDFPNWYGSKLYSLANIDDLESRLDNLDKNRNVAVADSDFIRIASEVYNLDVPVDISVDSYSTPYLVNNVDDVDISPILDYTGESSSGSSNDYASAILSWQNNNIEAGYSVDLYEMSSLISNEPLDLSVYSFDVKSLSDESSYFVIDAPLSSLVFSSDIGAKKAGNSTIIPLSPYAEGYFEFYYEGSDSLSYFVSPSLTLIVIESDIDDSCNHNSFCEENLGETVDNCRSDCRPVGRALWYVILSLVGVLFIYTVLQIWYNKRYEKYLFPDSRELYNMLMFVNNARIRGMKDSLISSNLRRQGWSAERVNFILKKASGKRTGLVEIIPVSKISSFFRKMKSEIQFKKEQKAKSNVASNNVPGPNNLPAPLGGSGGYRPKGFS